jgi:putative ubiquitin-RnfH superfamily antitoxin RatB of RatAB toxin-antitoxin module
MKGSLMRVEVVYAQADVQDIVALEVPGDAVVRHAVAASGLLARHGLAATRLQLGIFGEKVSPDSPLHEGDRVEILRPLALDPREARRRRARRTRV